MTFTCIQIKVLFRQGGDLRFPFMFIDVLKNGKSFMMWINHMLQLRTVYLPAAEQRANIAQANKSRYIPTMHFSRHISQLHSTSSLLAALLLRVAR